MKSIKMLADSTKRTINEILAANEAYRTECEKAEAYNAVTKNDKLDQAEQDRLTQLYHLKDVFLDAKKVSRSLTEEYLSGKFTMALSPEDEATLSNLSKITLSESEMRLHYEKYRNHPLALRRLQTIAKENDVAIHNSALAEVISGNLQDYDYYQSVFSDFENSCEQALTEVENLNPSRFGEFDQIIVDVQLATVDNATESAVKEFSKLEGIVNV